MKKNINDHFCMRVYLAKHDWTGESCWERACQDLLALTHILHYILGAKPQRWRCLISEAQREAGAWAFSAAVSERRRKKMKWNHSTKQSVLTNKHLQLWPKRNSRKSERVGAANNNTPHCRFTDAVSGRLIIPCLCLHSGRNTVSCYQLLILNSS